MQESHANKRAKKQDHGSNSKSSSAAVVSSSNGASSSDRSSSVDNDDTSPTNSGGGSHKKRPASDMATSSTAATAIASNRSRKRNGLYPLFSRLAKYAPERQVAWANLLITRPRSSQEEKMSQWLMQIMAVSDSSQPLPKSTVDLSDLSTYLQSNNEKTGEMANMVSMRCSSPEEAGSSDSLSSSTNQSSSEDITSSSSGSSSKLSASPSSSPSPSQQSDELAATKCRSRDAKHRKRRHKSKLNKEPPIASTSFASV